MKNAFLKKSTYSYLVFLLILIAVQRFYDYQNGGYRSSKILSNLPSFYATPPDGIDPLLDQSFRYLGRGGTSFVFLGEDQKTVLKLFKHHHLQQKTGYDRFFLPGVLDRFRIHLMQKARKKHEHKHHSFFFNSCKLGEEKLREEMGLIYLCLQPNPHFTHPVRLIDTWGIPHHVDLSRTEFALQQNSELFFPYLEKLHHAKNEKGIKELIHALLKQIQKRCTEGIGNRDPNLHINFGVVDSKVIEFDLGSYFSKPQLQKPPFAAQELFFCTYSLQKWLEKHSPDLLDYLLECIVKAATHETLP